MSVVMGNEKYNFMLNEIQKLQEENKLLRECVEFYADPLTYTYDKRIQDVPIDAFGSKKARKTLDKIKESDG